MLRLGTYLPLLSFALLLSCGKSLPKPTQEGKNTFGCKIDGRNWVPTGRPGGFSGRVAAIKGGYDGNCGSRGQRWNVHIRTYREDETVDLYINSVTKPGTFQLNFKTAIRPEEICPSSYGLYTRDQQSFYTTNETVTGTVQVVKADTVNLVVSGTFEFTAVNRRDPSKTIRVTKGRFDVGPN